MDANLKKLFLILILPLALIATDSKKQGTQKASLVVSAPLQKGNVNPLQTYVGTLYYDVQSNIASEEEGIVEQLAVSQGQHVKKGDLLVLLDSKILKTDIASQKSAIESFQADLTKKELILERSKALLKNNALSQTSYDNDFYAVVQLRSQIESSKHKLAGLQTRMNKRKIFAPYDAVVTARHVNIGEWVARGASVVSLAAIDTLEARVNLPATLINSLKNSQRFHARVGNNEFEATLKSIVPVADTITRTFPVEFNIPQNVELIAGMSIEIQVPTLQKVESFMIPRDAVIKRFGQNVVFANADGKAVMIPVQVVGYSDNKVAINAQGLTEGMRIVIKGNERIFPNMRIAEKK